MCVLITFAPPGDPSQGPVHISKVGSLNWQAFAVWQWYNYAASRVPAGKEPLRINLDETSLCLFQGDAKGTVLFRKKKKAWTKHASVDETRKF